MIKLERIEFENFLSTTESEYFLAVANDFLHITKMLQTFTACIAKKRERKLAGFKRVQLNSLVHRTVKAEL